MTPKQEALHALTDLPDEAGIEEAIERLHLLLKVHRGIAQADSGDTVSQEEARRRMERWLR